MSKVMRITKCNDNEFDKNAWHLIYYANAPMMLCTGQYLLLEFKESEETHALDVFSFITKDVKRGGVTCEKCLELIQQIKSYKK